MKGNIMSSFEELKNVVVMESAEAEMLRLMREMHSVICGGGGKSRAKTP